MKIFVVFFLFISSFLYGALISPSNDSNLRYRHILFEWEQEPDAQGYHLEVSNSQNFLNLVLSIELYSTIHINTEDFDWNSQYYWRVRPIDIEGIYGQWIGVATFSTEGTTLPNLDIDNYDDSLVQDGLIMYSQFSPYFAVGVIDKTGSEVWNTESVYMNHISKYGEIYGIANNIGKKINFKQNELWESDPDIFIDSHEVKQISNGNYMAFSPIYQIGPISIGPWTSYFQELGYQADGQANEFQWMGMQIIELDKNTGDLVWSWNPFEHFTMQDNDIYENTWWDAYFSQRFDWMHTNAFHFDEVDSVIYASHRHLSRISKIDYPSGEVIWNMGMPAEYNTGSNNICSDLGFSFQHNIQLLDNGDLLFFDNGNLSPLLLNDSNPTSRVRRIRVIDDSYCETIWQYELPQDLYGLGMGSVQLLENNNYLIYTYGNGLGNPECSIIEVNQSQEIVWKVTSQNNNSAWYRAYKFPSIHPEAFSVVAQNYTTDDGEAVIELNDNTLNFSVVNQSGFNQDYKFILSDLMDGSPQLFDYEQGEFELGPNGSINLSFQANNSDIESTMINLFIWPSHHEYAVKELGFTVIKSDSLLGDINGDNIYNILDVVLLVNIILDLSEAPNNADINDDNSVNILDIVLLVNLILDT